MQEGVSRQANKHNPHGSCLWKYYRLMLSLHCLRPALFNTNNNMST